MENDRDKLSMSESSRQNEYAVIDAGFIIRTVLREKWTIILCAVAATILAIVLALTIPDSYTANSRVLIDPQPSQLSSQRSGEGRAQVNESVVESKSYILKSNRVLERVIDKLNLHQDPQFVTLDDTDEPLARRLAMKSLNESVLIRQAGISFVLNVEATTYDPIVASDIANTIAQTFVELEQEAKLSTAKLANEWLLLRLQGLQELVSQSEGKLENFRAVSGVSVDQRISDLSQNLERLRLSLSEVSRVSTSSEGQDDARETALKQRIANTEAQLRQLTGKTIELRELERQADADRELYERFLERAKELDELANFQTADSRVIVDALPPLLPSGPRRKLIVILGAIFGVGLGIGVVALKELYRALPSGSLVGRKA